jgi:predicted CopG family antitoxin
MKKKITLSVDEKVYEDLKELPKKISISEIVNFMLQDYLERYHRGLQR